MCQCGSEGLPDVQLSRRIPQFVLYGEEAADVEMDFLHLETIRARSPLHEWVIRPHTHPDHAQVFLVTAGGADVQAEGQWTTLRAPSLFVVPAGTVHGMRFDPDSDGFVLTLSRAYARFLAAADPVLATATTRFLTLDLAGDPEGVGEAMSDFRRLTHDFVWPAPARRAAIAASTTRILVFVLRRMGESGADDGTRNRDVELVTAFRERIERDFRKGLPIGQFARGLAVTEARLNTACRRVTGRSASRLVHDRIMLEAKRSLLYTGMTVAEVSNAVGFTDPAYFSRFFARFAGEPPGRFRHSRREESLSSDTP